MSSLSSSSFLAHIRPKSKPPSSTAAPAAVANTNTAHATGTASSSTATASATATSTTATTTAAVSTEVGTVSLHVPAPPLDAALQRVGATNKEYVKLYTDAVAIAAGAGFGDIENLDVVRHVKSRDNFGRDIFVFLPSNLPHKVDLNRVVMYGILLMHKSVMVEGRPYTAVWVCNNDDEARQLGFFWLRRLYLMVPHDYHKQMRCLALVHPTISVRLLLLLLSYMLKHSFWDKLIYADRIEFLDEVVEPKLLDLPKAIYDYDKFLDHQAQVYADSTVNGAGGLGGMGPGFSMGSMGGLGGMGGMGETMGGIAAGVETCSPEDERNAQGVHPSWEKQPHYNQAEERAD